jgi:hypothetical protein
MANNSSGLRGNCRELFEHPRVARPPTPRVRYASSAEEPLIRANFCSWIPRVMFGNWRNC